MYWTRPRTSASASDIGTSGASRLGGLVTLVGHVSGPSEMRVLKPVFMKGLVSEKVHPGDVYSTFGSNTSKYPLKTPKPKSARVFWGKNACMIQKRLGRLQNRWTPQRWYMSWYPSGHVVKIVHSKEEDFVRLLC